MPLPIILRVRVVRCRHIPNPRLRCVGACRWSYDARVIHYSITASRISCWFRRLPRFRLQADLEVLAHRVLVILHQGFGVEIVHLPLSLYPFESSLFINALSNYTMIVLLAHSVVLAMLSSEQASQSRERRYSLTSR